MFKRFISFFRSFNPVFFPNIKYSKLHKTDYDAIKSDWDTVGQDMWAAIHKFEEQNGNMYAKSFVAGNKIRYIHDKENIYIFKKLKDLKTAIISPSDLSKELEVEIFTIYKLAEYNNTIL